MDNCRISILIPSYCSSKALPDLFDSLLQQNNLGFKVFVFDNSPTLDTWNVIKEYEQRFAGKGISFSASYLKDHIGVGGSVNALLKQVDTDYFLQIDSDDILEPTAIDKYYEEIRKDADIIFTSLFAYDETLRVPLWNQRYTTVKRKWVRDYIKIRNVHFGPQCIKTKTFKNSNHGLDIYPSKKGQNYQLILPIILLGKKCNISIIESQIHRYRIRANSLSHSQKQTAELIHERKEVNRIVRETLNRCACINPLYYIMNSARKHGELQDIYWHNNQRVYAFWHSLLADWAHKKDYFANRFPGLVRWVRRGR